MSVKLTMKAARVQAGYTQDSMARAMGITRCTYSKWELGKTPINTPAFYMFCQLVGFSTDDVLVPREST